MSTPASSTTLLSGVVLCPLKQLRVGESREARKQTNEKKKTQDRQCLLVRRASNCRHHFVDRIPNAQVEVPSADLPHLPMSCHALLPRPRPRATRLLICRPRLSESGHRLTWTNLAGQAQIWTNVSDLLSPHHSING